MTTDARRPDYPNLPDGWFRRAGRSGLLLPSISLGCWHNFGGHGHDAARSADEQALHDNCRALLRTAFSLGVTHFDLANNYGPPPGSAESRVGRILREDFRNHRDELIVSTKAGFGMWPGPYGDHGSRKYLLASLDQSLQRLGLDYVDVFYHHRPDPHTPLDETLSALEHAVRSGKALYCAVSSYDASLTRRALDLIQHRRWPRPVLHQPIYSILDRWIEEDRGVADTCGELGLGVIVFCPLAQGLLTDKYLSGDVPDDSRAAVPSGFLKQDRITPEVVAALNGLNDLAQSRGQSLAQMALSWVLRDPRITSALIGASRPAQIEQNVHAAERTTFSTDELARIDELTRDL